MKTIGSVYILSLICIGSVCTEFNPEEYLFKYGYLTVKPGISGTDGPTSEEIIKAIFKFQTYNGLPQTGKIDEITKKKMLAPRCGVKDITPQNTSEPTDGFCNYSYNSIDATMRINGNDFVFVDKGEVINRRTGRKISVQILFLGGPIWVQAAVYSKLSEEVYLFKNNKIWAFVDNGNGAFDLIKRFRNSNKQSYNPECAFQYFNSDMLFLLKNKHFFKFEPYFPSEPVRKGSRTLEMFSIDRRVDAAISSSDDVNFIVKDKVYRIGNSTRIKTNQLFSKCGN